MSTNSILSSFLLALQLCLIFWKIEKLTPVGARGHYKNLNGVVASTITFVPNILPTETLSRSCLQGGVFPWDHFIRSGQGAREDG